MRSLAALMTKGGDILSNLLKFGMKADLPEPEEKPEDPAKKFLKDFYKGANIINQFSGFILFCVNYDGQNVSEDKAVGVFFGKLKSRFIQYTDPKGDKQWSEIKFRTVFWNLMVDNEPEIFSTTYLEKYGRQFDMGLLQPYPGDKEEVEEIETEMGENTWEDFLW